VSDQTDEGLVCNSLSAKCNWHM